MRLNDTFVCLGFGGGLGGGLGGGFGGGLPGICPLTGAPLGGRFIGVFSCYFS